MSTQSDRSERLIGLVRHWADVYGNVCALSQQRAITAADFDPIAEMVADDFTRIGIYKDEADWPLCLEKYLQFAGTSQWTGKVRYLHVAGNTVFQELEETIARPQGENVIYTNTVYEFDDNDKVRSLRIYIQQDQAEENVLIRGADGRQET